MSLEHKDPIDADTKDPSSTDVDEVDRGASTIVAISAEDDGRIRRKIDINLLPLICVVVALQFVSRLDFSEAILTIQLDKTCMSYAAVMGFREDTGLSLSDYSWLGSIFCASRSWDSCFTTD